jgi:hypothetical protein
MLAEILANPVAWPLWAVLAFAATMYPLGLLMPGCVCCGNECTYEGPIVSDTAADGITWIAQSFVVPSGVTTLTKATWAIDSYEPIVSGMPGSVPANYPKCYLYSSTSSGGMSSAQPSSMLIQLSGPTVLASDSWEFTTSYALTGGDRYWVVLINNGTPIYYYSPECDKVPGCCGQAYAVRFSLGGAWAASGLTPADPYAMTIN